MAKKSLWFKFIPHAPKYSPDIVRFFKNLYGSDIPIEDLNY